MPSKAATSWRRASEIFAAAGVKEDTSFYGPFTSEDEKAVLTVPMLVRAAWEANDADAFADLFTENGSELILDDQLTSREEIRSYMAAGFNGIYKGSRVVGWPVAVRFLSEDAAMVITGGGVLIAGDTELTPERELRSTWIIQNQDGTPKLFSHQSSPIKG
jgi:uncharacterized protein (TIGR02246 family)